MLPIPHEFPVRERLRLPGWVVALHSEIGPVRERLEDAWRILPNGSWQGAPAVVVGIFDGLGGEPNGQEAAWTAAEHLPHAVQSARDPGAVLALLNEYVRPTGGFTTAVVAIAPRTGPAWFVTAGDSAAYARHGSGARLINAKDAGPGSMVTRYLGMPEIETTSNTFEIASGHAVLLCTDGVDDVAGSEAVARTIAHPDSAAALEDLFADLHAKGCPDNATAVLLRRTL